MASHIKEIVRGGVRQTLARMGYHISRTSMQTSDSAYEPVHPYAEYSPWNIDPVFMDVYNKIKLNTMVDKYKCYELWQLIDQTKHLEGSIIEIGVWRGGTGALIAKRARLCGITDPVYLCDTFRGIVKANEKDADYRGGEYSDTSPQVVEKLVNDVLQVSNVKVLKGIFPDDTGHLISDPVFRLCHVDVDVYQSAHDIVDWIWDRMPVGGIIIFDDYGFIACDGITRYVDEQRELKDRVVIHNLNGHAVMVKIR